MRSTWLAVPFVLTLAACGDETTANQSGAADQVLADDRLTGNDLTAIDAVSGSDANMAADVEFNAIDENASDDGAAGDRPARRAAPAGTSRSSRDTGPVPADDEPSPAPEPATQPPVANSN